MFRILLNSLGLTNEDLGKNRNTGIKREETRMAPLFRKKTITRFKKQSDVDERRVQFPSLRNGRDEVLDQDREGRRENRFKRTFAQIGQTGYSNTKSIEIVYLTFTMGHGQFKNNKCPQLTLDKKKQNSHMRTM